MHVDAKRHLAVLFAAASVSGCAPTPAHTYVAPSDGPTAKLRFRTNQEHGFTRLARIDLTNCPDGVKAERVATIYGKGLNEQREVSTLHMIGSTDKAEITIRERLIEAGKPFVFSIFGSANTAAANMVGSMNCGMAGVFVPQPSKEYELAYSLLVQEHKCISTIYVLSLDAAGDTVRTREPTQKYTHDKITEGKDYCGKF